MNKESKIYVAGHTGLVGSAVVRLLEANGYTNILTATHKDLDLTNPYEVDMFIGANLPEYVIMCAGLVGGIKANNDSPASFLFDNAYMALNVIGNCVKYKVSKLIYLGSSCIYPNDILEPITEDRLLTSKLEPTNEGYAVAKILGTKAVELLNKQLSKKYLTLMPCNLYGINDNFNLSSSHVLPALIRKIHEAKVNNKATVTLWGDGSPLREFLYVDDLAEAILKVLTSDDIKDSILNVGSSKDITIKSLAEAIVKVVGYTGSIIWDSTKPNGTFKKLLDSSKLKDYGWKPKTSLIEGIRKVYNWYLKNEEDIRDI